MKRFPYYLLNPTGNVTILSPAPVTEPELKILPAIARELMSYEPTAEQAGFTGPGDGDCDISLTMAGGEFCGNAAMSAAALYVWLTSGDYHPEADIGKNGLGANSLLAEDQTEVSDQAETAPASEENLKTVTVRVSGAEKPVAVYVTRTGENEFSGRVKMPEPLSVTTEKLENETGSCELPVVRLPGICHVIAELPPAEKSDSTGGDTKNTAVEDSAQFIENLYTDRTLAEKTAKKWCRDLKADALGIMFISPDRTELTPLVYVRTANTMFWENSCASGTTAAGAWYAHQSGTDVKMKFKQPAGILGIDISSAGLFLSGKVIIEKNAL